MVLYKLRSWASALDNLSRYPASIAALGLENVGLNPEDFRLVGQVGYDGLTGKTHRLADFVGNYAHKAIGALRK